MRENTGTALSPLMDLRRCLRILASLGSDQPPLFPEGEPTADGAAADFERSLAALQATGTVLSEESATAVHALAGKLRTMSRDGAEFDADLWTERAVRTSESWADVRALAAAALAAMDATGTPEG